MSFTVIFCSCHSLYLLISHSSSFPFSSNTSGASWQNADLPEIKLSCDFPTTRLTEQSSPCLLDKIHVLLTASCCLNGASCAVSPPLFSGAASGLSLQII